MVTFSRTFRVIADQPGSTSEEITIIPSLIGTIATNDPIDFGGAYGASVFAEVEILKSPQDLVFRYELEHMSEDFQASVDIASPWIDLFEEGFYWISGRLEVGAFALSGPGRPRSDFRLEVSTPGVRPVPEGSSWALLTVGGLLALGRAGRRFVPPRIRSRESGRRVNLWDVPVDGAGRRVGQRRHRRHRAPAAAGMGAG